MQRLKAGLLCVLLIALTTLAGVSAVAVWRVQAALCTVPGIVSAELAAATAGADRQITAARVDITSRVDAALTRVDAAIATVNTAEADANSQIAGARKDIADFGKMADVRLAAATDMADRQLGAVATATAALERRYTGLPDEIRADREYQGLIAQTMGVLGAAKVTMGQAAKTAKVIADEAPKMTDHADQIAEDITREADLLTKPQSFWAAVRSWLLTLARIWGAI